MGQAVREGIAEEMRLDETVFVIGEDVAEAGTHLKFCKGSSRSSDQIVLWTRPSRRQASLAWPWGQQ